MGRRAYTPETRRRNSLQAYFTDEEFERVYHVATKQGMHLSAWVRSILLREIEKKGAVA